MPRLPLFIRQQPALAAFAVLATAGSGFGQTYLIAVFGTVLRDSFALSHSLYGLVYGGATVCAALVLLRIGSLADRWPLSRLVTLAVVILALGCTVLGLSQHLALLTLAFFLTRLGGQGLMSHIGLTTAGRYFHRHRGRVVALTGSGFALSEACLPMAAVALLGAFGWRVTWLCAAALLLFVLLPLCRYLTRDAPAPTAAPHGDGNGVPGGGWRRGQVLRDTGFYLLLPSALVTPFVVTAILFHQSAIAAAKGWPLSLMAAAFGGYAAGHLFGLFVAGAVVDRITAQRTLPLSLLPMASGMLLLAMQHDTWVPLAYLTLTGVSQGAMATAGGTLWPERYGTRHLGAVRSLVQSVMIITTAIAPVVTGVLLDAQVSVGNLAWLLLALILLGVLLALAAPPPASGPEGPPVAPGRQGRGVNEPPH